MSTPSRKSTYAPLLQPTTTRPLSDSSLYRSNIGLSLLRNQFTLSTLLLCGATLQIALSLLPIRKIYTILPALFVLSLRALSHLLMLTGYTSNPYMNGIIPGKTTALYPTSTDGSTAPESRKICIVLLSVRANAPTGVFNKTFSQIGSLNSAMKKDLEENASSNGFLGATSWLGASEARTTSTELMTVFYFRSRADVHAWAHAGAHREGWDFWTKLVKEGKAGPFTFVHELFEAEKGAWEGIYLNAKPTGFGTATHEVEVEETGEKMWVSGLVDAKRGKFRSSNGRQGLDDGTGNEKYGEEYY